LPSPGPRDRCPYRGRQPDGHGVRPRERLHPPIAAALQVGNAKTAIETGEALDLAALLPGCTGRRTQLHLDLTRAYALRMQDAAVVNLLLAAERLSRNWSRYDTRTRDVLTTLLRREHQPSTPGCARWPAAPG
jgi:hypothetical protein